MVPSKLAVTLPLSFSLFRLAFNNYNLSFVKQDHASAMKDVNYSGVFLSNDLLMVL